jgi:hypothetical protein
MMPDGSGGLRSIGGEDGSEEHIETVGLTLDDLELLLFDEAGRKVSTFRTAFFSLPFLTSLSLFSLFVLTRFSLSHSCVLILVFSLTRFSLVSHSVLTRLLSLFCSHSFADRYPSGYDDPSKLVHQQGETLVNAQTIPPLHVSAKLVGKSEWEKA